MKFTIPQPAPRPVIDTEMTDLRSIALVILLTGCSRMTQPSDITVALELCSQRGGYSHVARYQNGNNGSAE